MNRWQRPLYQPNQPLGQDGQRVTACKEHRALAKQAAKEGMVRWSMLQACMTGLKSCLTG